MPGRTKPSPRKKPLYSGWKADLIKRGLYRGPLFTKNNKPRLSLRQQGIQNPSRYQRKQELPSIVKTRGQSKKVRKQVQIGEEFDYRTDRMRPRMKWRTVTVPGEVIKENVLWPVKRLSKRGRGGRTGGAKDLGVSRKTGSAAARKLRNRAARVSGKKGAIPRKEPRKQKKKK